MFVITADQIDSRNGADQVESTIADVTTELGDRALLPPERTAGDEFQLVTASADGALDTLLLLGRTGTWSIGLGIGDVDDPLPRSTRAASGSAFFRAREAVDRAKQLPEHFALEVEAGRRLRSLDVEPLVAQTIRARSRRTPEGWELADLLAAGRTRTDAARELGISPQAVAKRFAVAGLHEDPAVRAALVRLLAEADEPADTVPVPDRAASDQTA